MEKIKKLFCGTDLSWKKIIIMAIVAGVYTAIMAILPIAKNTSFEDITITIEVWVLFGIFIIMNSKSAKDSSLKCFIFFLISQPLVYLLQVPFSTLRWQIFIYYRYWFIWTLLTIPMGYIGYYMKKDKWWGLVILTPILILIGKYGYSMHLGELIYSFPCHLLTILFCIVTMLAYPILIFNNKKIKITGIIISILIIFAMTTITFLSNTGYNTTVLVSGGSAGAVFDDSYKVYLEDSSYGKVYIVYEDSLENYMVNAEFKKTGKTNIILEDANGNKEVYEIDIKNNTYDINKK